MEESRILLFYPAAGGLKFVAGDNRRLRRPAIGDEVRNLSGGLWQVSAGLPAPSVHGHSVE
jgi:hypothetical protein